MKHIELFHGNNAQQDASADRNSKDTDHNGGACEEPVVHQIPNTVQCGLHINVSVLELESVIRDEELDLFKTKVIVVKLFKDFDRDELSVWASKPSRCKWDHASDVTNHKFKATLRVKVTCS